MLYFPWAPLWMPEYLSHSLLLQSSTLWLPGLINWASSAQAPAQHLSVHTDSIILLFSNLDNQESFRKAPFIMHANLDTSWRTRDDDGSFPVAEGWADREYPQSGDMRKLSSWGGSMPISEPTPTVQPQAKGIMQIFLLRTKCPNEMNLAFPQISPFIYPPKTRTCQRKAPYTTCLLATRISVSHKKFIQCFGGSICASHGSKNWMKKPHSSWNLLF